MRLSVTKVCVALFVMLSAPGVLKAQDEKVVFPRTPISVGGLMSTVQSQTKYVFAFENTSFDTMRTVSVNPLTMSVKEAMDQLALQTGCSYMVQKKFIMINSQVKNADEDVVLQPVVSSMGDVYEQTDLAQLQTEPRRRPVVVTAPNVIYKEETVYVVPEREIVQPYSVYESPDFYTPIKNDLPVLALRIDLLYAGVTLTPNLSAEIGLSRKSTIEITGSYNPWNRKGSQSDNDKFVHWIIRPEYRYWFCERFNGHYVGAHVFYSKYNIGGYKVPMLFKKQYRYEGDAYGAGIVYGYHLSLAKRWGLEFTAGVGVARLKYDRFECEFCSRDSERKTKTYVGPTRLGVSVVFMIK